MALEQRDTVNSLHITKHILAHDFRLLFSSCKHYSAYRFLSIHTYTHLSRNVAALKRFLQHLSSLVYYSITMAKYYGSKHYITQDCSWVLCMYCKTDIYPVVISRQEKSQAKESICLGSCGTDFFQTLHSFSGCLRSWKCKHRQKTLSHHRTYRQEGSFCNSITDKKNIHISS